MASDLTVMRPPNTDYPNLRGVPALWSQWFAEASFVNQAGRLQTGLPGVRHLVIDNRLPRAVYAQLAMVDGQASIAYIVDAASTLRLNSRVPFFQLTLFDLWLTGRQNPLGMMFGESEGVRADESLPFGIWSGASGALPRRVGGVLVSGSSEPMEVAHERRTVRPKINYAQEAVSTGSVLVLDSAVAAVLLHNAGYNGVGGVGYFELATFSNGSTAAYTCSIYPVGSNFTLAKAYTITVDAGAAFTVPVEAEQIGCNFGATGQHVIAWQAIAVNEANEP